MLLSIDELEKVIRDYRGAVKFGEPFRTMRMDTDSGSGLSHVLCAYIPDGSLVKSCRYCDGEGLLLSVHFGLEGEPIYEEIHHCGTWLCIGDAARPFSEALERGELDIALSVIASQFGDKSPCEFIDAMVDEESFHPYSE